MREKRMLSLLIITVNIIGDICLLCFTIPYLTHNMLVVNPDVMLPAEAWDHAGMVLTVGFIPLLIANSLAFAYVQVKQKLVRVLFWIPSVICFILVVSYWITSLS